MKNYVDSPNKVTPQHKKSKFVVDMSVYGIFQVVFGKLPKKDGQLWNGETTKGEKMQMCGNTDEPDCPIPYWGW